MSCLFHFFKIYWFGWMIEVEVENLWLQISFLTWWFAAAVDKCLGMIPILSTAAIIQRFSRIHLHSKSFNFTSHQQGWTLFHEIVPRLKRTLLNYQVCVWCCIFNWVQELFMVDAMKTKWRDCWSWSLMIANGLLIWWLMQQLTSLGIIPIMFSAAIIHRPQQTIFNFQFSI